MADYARDLVDIKGKKYQPVASRLRMALDAPPEVVQRIKSSLLHSCTTEVLYNTEKHLGVKVSVRLKDEYGGGIFEGVAESDRQAKSIEGDSPLEVAETSALGRALAKAGILIDLAEFSSANEVYKNQVNERNRARAASGINETASRPFTSNSASSGSNGPLQAATSVEESNGTLPLCVDCGTALEGFTDAEGKVYSPEALAISREKRFGRVLCTSCVRKARKTA